MVGIFVIREKPDILYVSSLVVAPEFRRLGIATYMLDYAHKLAKQLGKEWLELSVLRVNIPTLRFTGSLASLKRKKKDGLSS
ncbi:MAG: GNAT family N-acetyltransferase [Candidatus Bathyarchaeota archaeon]|nr:GNAT family N-acetyltransferase [Candidatus Bathyarchaeota archaeon]MDH5494714.1 GNAT family N-acetyltransferase [Candidatus Bathyarchaeota archaeon]